MNTRLRWWHCGLIGAFTLSIATAQNGIGAIPGILNGSASNREMLIDLPIFATGIFSVGFSCGLVGWMGWRVLRRAGGIGDALTGALVLNVFLGLCYAWFGGVTGGWFDLVFFGTFGTVVGAAVGYTTGRDIRRDHGSN